MGGSGVEQWPRMNQDPEGSNSHLGKEPLTMKGTPSAPSSASAWKAGTGGLNMRPFGATQ